MFQEEEEIVGTEEERRIVDLHRVLGRDLAIETVATGAAGEEVETAAAVDQEIVHADVGLVRRAIAVRAGTAALDQASLPQH